VKFLSSGSVTGRSIHTRDEPLGVRISTNSSAFSGSGCRSSVNRCVDWNGRHVFEEPLYD
jgi:hypothetical protein